MHVLDPHELVGVVGGEQSVSALRDQHGGIVSGPGAYNRHTAEYSKSAGQRFNEAMDRVNTPWKLFNGVFGAASARAPQNRMQGPM